MPSFYTVMFGTIFVSGTNNYLHKMLKQPVLIQPDVHMIELAH